MMSVMEKTLPLLRPLDRFYVLAFAAMPLIGMLAPRALAFAPALLALVGLAIFVRQERRLPALPRRPLIWALGLSGFLLASPLWAVDGDLAFSRALSAALVMITTVLLLALSRSISQSGLQHFRRLFPKALLTACILCLALFGVLIGRALYETGWERWVISAQTTFFNLSAGNRGVVFLFLLLIAAVPFLRPLIQMPQQRSVIAFAACCFALVFVVTDSQSSQLALAVAALTYFLFPWRRRKAWPALFLLLAAGVMLSPWVVQILFHQFAAPLSEMPWFTAGYAHERLEIWDFIARTALAHPWLGLGLEATRTFQDIDMQYLFFKETSVLHPHNAILQIWVELGALGAAILAALLIAIARGIRDLPGDGPRHVLPVFAGMLTIACTTYGLWQGWWLGALGLLLVLTDVIARTAQTLPDISEN